MDERTMASKINESNTDCHKNGILTESKGPERCIELKVRNDIYVRKYM